MTLGLSKTHGIFFGNGHFNKAVYSWATQDSSGVTEGLCLHCISQH